MYVRPDSTGLTPESEKYYEHVPATFPSDWYDYNGPGCDGLKLKKEAPERAHTGPTRNINKKIE